MALFGFPRFGYFSDHYDWTVVVSVVAAANAISALTWLCVRCDLPLLMMIDQSVRIPFHNRYHRRNGLLNGTKETNTI